MGLKRYTLTFKGFKFPADLPNDKANYRFLVDVRFLLDNGELGKPLYAVLPDFDTFWECDRGRSKKPNYVRSPDLVQDESGEALSKFDMARIEQVKDTILVFAADRLFSINIKIFDVNRVGLWEKIKDTIGPILTQLSGMALGGFVNKVTRTPVGKFEIPGAVSDAFGSALQDLQSHLLQKVSGGRDSVLCQMAKKYSDTEVVLMSLDDDAPFADMIRASGTNGKGESKPYVFEYEIQAEPLMEDPKKLALSEKEQVQMTNFLAHVAGDSSLTDVIQGFTKAATEAIKDNVSSKYGALLRSDAIGLTSSDEIEKMQGWLQKILTEKVDDILGGNVAKEKLEILKAAFAEKITQSLCKGETLTAVLER